MSHMPLYLVVNKSNLDSSLESYTANIFGTVPNMMMKITSTFAKLMDTLFGVEKPT